MFIALKKKREHCFVIVGSLSSNVLNVCFKTERHAAILYFPQFPQAHR